MYQNIEVYWNRRQKDQTNKTKLLIILIFLHNDLSQWGFGVLGRSEERRVGKD